MRAFCSIVLHPPVNCSREYLFSASPASSEVPPFSFFVPVCCCALYVYGSFDCRLNAITLLVNQILSASSVVICRNLLYPVDVSATGLLCLFSLCMACPVVRLDLLCPQLQYALSDRRRNRLKHKVVKRRRNDSLRNVLCRSRRSPVCTWPKINARCRVQCLGHNSPCPPPSCLPPPAVSTCPCLSALIPN